MDNLGISKLDVKRANRMQILKQFRNNGPTSRMDLSKQLKLTRAAVTIITNEMIDAGILMKKGEAKKEEDEKLTRGRKKILIDINPNYKFALGAAVDSNLISVGLSNLNGDILGKRIQKFDDGDFNYDTVISLITDFSKEIIQESCLETSQIVGMGLGIEWLLTQRINFGKNCKKIEQDLSEALHLPVKSDRLVRALLYADLDFKKTVTKRPENMVFTVYNDDMTSAVLLNGEIYEGQNEKASNLNHAVIDIDGTECPICGKRGCFYTKTSVKLLKQKIEHAYSKENTPLAFEATDGSLDNLPKYLNSTPISEFDQVVFEIYKEVAKYAALQTDMVLSAYDPEYIVVMGASFDNRPVFEENIKFFIKLMNGFLGYDITDYVIPCNIKVNTEYLAGCALAIREFFIDKGAL